MKSATDSLKSSLSHFIDEKISHSIEKVSKVTEQQSATMQEVSDSTQKFSHQATHLESVIQNFNI